MSHEKPYADSYGQEESHRFGRRAVQTPATAVLSAIFGVISFPLMCGCFLSIPTSLIAIVLGHVAKGIIRNAPERFGGESTANLGLISGYLCLALTLGMLGFVMLAEPKPGPPTIVPPQNQSAEVVQTRGSVLLEQAQHQLLSESAESATGVSTCELDAKALARHFVETLHIVDRSQFAETNPDLAGDQDIEPRAYRAFVQLNDDSVAFLLFVPDYVRFTPAAAETLKESCWLIAQRSVDDLLPQGTKLAVAISSANGLEDVMTGTTTRDEAAYAGREQESAAETALSTFFRLPNQSAPEPRTAESPTDSQIDTKDVPGELNFPAEAE